MSNSSTENRLNHLSAQEWLRFTKTWFIHNPPPRKKNEILHPAKYPEQMIAEFIKFFTKEGAVVVDPFLGTGSTLVACHTTQRHGIGIELQEKYAKIAEERIKVLEQQRESADSLVASISLQQRWKLDVSSDERAAERTKEGARPHCKQIVIRGNAAEFEKYWQEFQLPQADLVITSPPYGAMLQKKGLVSKERKVEGLDVQYSNDPEDLGNAENYELFVQKLVEILSALRQRLKPEAHLVIILQNYMNKGEYKTLAWDVGKELSKIYQFRGERIWCQDNKTLYPYGYRYSFVPNVHHHYCLIFKNVES